MNISTLRPFAGPLLLSLLLVAAALLLWRVPAAQAGQTVYSESDCFVVDKTTGVDAAARRVETMLTMHRGW